MLWSWLICTQLWAAGADWKLIHDEPDLRVWIRPEPGSTVAAFRGETWVPASLDAVLALTADPKACPRWIYQCRHAEVLERHGFHRRLTYQVNDMPWPAQDRDIVLEVTIRELSPGGAVRVDMISRPDALPDRGLVRVQRSSGHYTLTPERGGVRVVWEQHTDPGGALPGWLVNQLLENLPEQTLRGLARLAIQPPYSRAHLARDAQGRIAGWPGSNWLALKR